MNSLPAAPAPELSVVIPVYGNEGSLPHLVQELEAVLADLAAEVVFVVDGSPDRSLAVLEALLPDRSFASQLLVHSRNFGSFAAIRSGMAAARGAFISVLSADLQEPTELVTDFLGALQRVDADIAVGVRTARADRKRDRLSSELFWALYRRLVQPEIPPGGVDIFGCTARVRDELLRMQEANSSLVGLLIWMGFRRVEVPYARAERLHGESGWTVSKKVRYLFDSIFSFTGLPIRVVTVAGVVGTLVSVLTALVVVIARLAGEITVPGYAPTVLAIAFFGALNLMAIGIIGSYLWRTFENTKQRPFAFVARRVTYPAEGS